MIISTAQTKPIAGHIEKNIEQHLELIELANQVGALASSLHRFSITRDVGLSNQNTLS